MNLLSRPRMVLAAMVLATLGISGSAEANRPPNVSILSPFDGAEYEHGDLITFAATASDWEDGDLTESIAWVSSIDGDIGRGGTVVTNDLTPGEHFIFAFATDSGDAAAYDLIVVFILGNRPADVVITAPMDGMEYLAGDTVTFAGTAFDYEDGELTDNLVWYSSVDGVIGTGGAFSRTLSPGEHFVTAVVTDVGGMTGYDIIVVFIVGDAAPDVVISAPHDGSEFSVGATISFSATASDLEDGDLTPGLEWVSTIDGLIGLGGSFSAVLSPGEHIITAGVTDSGGAFGEDVVVVFVVGDAPPDVIISAPLDGAEYANGAAITFRASANDLEDGEITEQLQWTSSIDGMIGLGGEFTVALTPGEHIIAATVTDSGGVIGHDMIAVIVELNTAPIVAVTSPLDGGESYYGISVHFAGSAFDFEDGEMTNDLVWTSNLAGEIGIGAEFTTTLGVGEHIIMASATDSQGLRGSQVFIYFVEPRGDMNSDGEIDGDDIQYFVDAVFDGSTLPADLNNGDFNLNGIIDGGDADGFKHALLNQ